MSTLGTAVFTLLFSLTLLAGPAALYRDARTGLSFQYAGKASTAEQARDLCRALPGTVPANRYLLQSLWKSWPAFKAAQGAELDDCVLLSPFDDERPAASETCVAMDNFDYFAFHTPRPVLCVAGGGQEAIWLDASTGLHWKDIGLVSSEADAQTKCQASGERWRLVDVLDVDTAYRRLRDPQSNPDLKVDDGSCYAATWKSAHGRTPTCVDRNGGTYLAHYPTRALCVQDKE